MEPSQIIATERAFWMESAEEDFIAGFVAQREDAAAAVAKIADTARDALYRLPECPLWDDALAALNGIILDATVTTDMRQGWHDEAVDAWNNGEREVDIGTHRPMCALPAPKGHGVWVAEPFGKDAP
tara:strand:- start:1200 stop:1580 length:381 start_codon:yes stop_codon:yes gene_type:complete